LPWFILNVIGEAYPPQDEETWQKTWQVIAGMDGLQSLRVMLNKFWMPRCPESAAQLFGPMCAVKGLKVFEVEVCWPADGSEHTLELDSVPYTIKRSPECP